MVPGKRKNETSCLKSSLEDRTVLLDPERHKKIFGVFYQPFFQWKMF